MKTLYNKIERYFSELVELDSESQNLKIEELYNSSKINKQEYLLIKELLAAENEDTTIPENIKALTDDWDPIEAAERIEEEPLIGHYRLIKLLGSGGMGHVYLAKRDDGSYDQEVALKMSQFHFDETMFKRFENERQILAKLSHPNIAQLLDGGTAKDNRPYLVMELIKGDSIDKYCITNNIGLRDRLELILQICSAVSFAHQNFVLHRDLKPANILVNNSGQVKLLDFGIAKLLSDDINLNTQTATQIMTKGYASPEQIKGELVSTQSDIFSLAVVTYELISGYHPFIGKTGVERDLRVLSGQIKSITVRNNDDEAIFPALTTVNPDRLKGDLENILLKALSPEPENRYSSVDAFALDIRNFLENRPVLARKPSKLYRFKKTIQRHKAVSAMIVVATSSLIFASIYSWQKAEIAEEQATLARAETEKANVVSEFLTGLFEKSNPARNKKLVSIQDVLVEGLNNLDHDNDISHEIKFHLLSKIYRSLWNLGDFALTSHTINRHYNECTYQLGKEFGSCQDLLIGQFSFYNSEQQYDKALEILNKAEKISMRSKSNDLDVLLYLYDTKVITLMNLERNDEAIIYGLKALELRKNIFSNDPHKITTSMNNLALSFIQAKNFKEASNLINEIPEYIQLIEDPLIKNSSLGIHNELKAFYYQSQRDSIKAAEFRGKAISIYSKTYDVLPSQTIWSYRVYASELAKAGLVDEALKQYLVTEKLYKNQVNDNGSGLYRIGVERLLIYLLMHDYNSAINAMNTLNSIDFEVKKSSSNYKKWVISMALLSIELENIDESKKQVNLVNSLLNEIDRDSIFYVYKLIVNARFYMKTRDVTNAIKTFEDMEKYWQKFPKFYLNIKDATRADFKLLNQELNSN